MAIGSKGLTPADLDGMDNERLSEELSKAKAELFNLRFAAATGQLEDHGRLKGVATSPASTRSCASVSSAFAPPRARRSPSERADQH